MRSITLAVVHCTATREGQDVTVEDVDCWHRARGWSGIGYHKLIDLDGKVHVGRSEERIGAHVAGYNSHSLGVAYVGGLDAYGDPKDTRTDAQKKALINVLNDWVKRYPIVRIAGHREFAAKACPCFDAAGEYADFLNLDENQIEPEIGAQPDFLLKRGNFGPDVRGWQSALAGFAYPDLEVDGDFGPATEEATLWFQMSRGVLADGIVGPQSKEVMDEVTEALAEL